MKLIKFFSWNTSVLISNFLVSFICIPIYLQELDSSTFAVLTLLWTILSVSTILDFGICRSIVREFSVLINEKKEKLINYYTSTSLCLSVIFGLCAALIIFVFFSLYAELTSDTLVFSKKTIYLVSISVFFNIVNLSILSIFEGKHLINISSLLRSIYSLFFLGIPALIIIKYNAKNLETIIFSIAIIKMVQFLISLLVLIIKTKGLKFIFFKKIAIKLIRFGKWVTVSNLISVIMSYGDRFIMGYFLKPNSLVNYSISSDLIQKGNSIMSLLPSSLFPLISSSNKTSLLELKKLLIIITVSSLLGVSLGFYFIEDFFKIWIGDNYNTEMITVFRVMLVGWFFSSFGQIFIAKIHSEGNTKITAKIHMYEGVIYIPAMIFSILKFGLLGAASVYSLRLFIDSLLLYYYSQKDEK